MTIKIIAGTCIILGGFLFGKNLSDDMKRRRENIKDIISALVQMEHYIVTLSMPLERIYEKLSGDGDVGKMFFEMANSGERSQKKLWKNSLRHPWGLNKEDTKPLEELSGVLGAEGKEHQKRHIEICIEKMQKRLEDAEKRYSMDGMLCKKMGIYIGILIVILLM